MELNPFYAGKINSQFAENKVKTKLMWCYRFIKRHWFSIRRVSHIGQTIPENMNKIKVSFSDDVIKMKKKLDIPFE